MLGYPCGMAKNKRDIDAQVKRDEIAAHALDLFLQNGFDATSMALISRSAGIAPNTIYWYFTGKDEVFVAALERLTAQLMEEFVKQDMRSISKQLGWVVQQLGHYRQLINTVHARLDQSQAVNDWHEGFHRMLEAILVAQLAKSGVPEKRARMITTVGTFVIEGLLSHPHTPKQQDAVLAWLSGGGV